MAVTASRILVLNPRFTLHQDEELDALVDRIGALLMRTRQQDDAVLYALVTCVNTHVLHVQQQQQQQQHDETSVAFPLLQGMEATVLAKLVLEKCKQDLACRWNLSANDSRRLDLWSFCTLLLKHMTQCRSSTTSNNLQEWLHHCFRHEQQQQQQHDSTATLKAKVDDFMKACTMFGEELLEMGLDILDQATESMETTTTTTTTTTVNNVAIHSTWTCLSTTQVLQEGLGIQLPYSMVQSLFTAYASFVAVLCHKTANDLKPFACELLVELAHYVLLQQEPATFKSAAMETTLSITLFCALDSGISKDDALLSLILEHMHPSRAAILQVHHFHSKHKRGNGENKTRLVHLQTFYNPASWHLSCFHPILLLLVQWISKNPRTRLQDCFNPFPCPKRRIRGIRWWRERFKNRLIWILLLLILLGTRRKYQVEQYRGLIAYWNNMWWIINRGHFYNKNE
jgi:hypothetical protein